MAIPCSTKKGKPCVPIEYRLQDCETTTREGLTECLGDENWQKPETPRKLSKKEEKLLNKYVKEMKKKKCMRIKGQPISEWKKANKKRGKTKVKQLAESSESVSSYLTTETESRSGKPSKKMKSTKRSKKLTSKQRKLLKQSKLPRSYG